MLNQDWTNSKLIIYNRWGVKVYNSQNNSYPIWDMRTEIGTYVTPGTYYYTFLTPGENQQRINGFFTVIHSD